MTGRDSEFLKLHGHYPGQFASAYCELCNPRLADRLSRTPEVEADVRKYGHAFLSVDASIRLHAALGIKEPWDYWEYPRRLAAIRLLNEEPTQGRLM